MNTKQKPNTPLRALAVGVSVCLMAACASTPQKSPELVRLENELSRLRADPVVAGNAGAELSEAQRAIDLIASDGKRMRADLYDHNVYLAGRLLDIAESEGRATHARDASERLVAERDRLVADARAMEADRARREANAARAAADQARMQASDASRAADMARAQAEAERLQAMLGDRALVRWAMRYGNPALGAEREARGLGGLGGGAIGHADRLAEWTVTRPSTTLTEPGA